MSESVGLYLHVPFCLKKCPYCDFYSVAKKPDEREFLAIIKEDIRRKKSLLEERFSLREIRIITFYAGGGTPSLLSSAFYDSLFSELSRHFIFEPVELTIEANPEGLTLEKLSGYKEVGFNRLSLGVQSLSNRGLRFLSRVHDAKTALKALEMGAKVFENLSFDLIYGYLGQGVKTLLKELSLLLNFPVKHISLYELTSYEGTPFAERFGERQRQKNLRLGRKLFLASHEFLEERGFIHYEISNYAKPSYFCQHNLLYWDFKPYLGIGPGAVSRIENLRWKDDEVLEELTPLDMAKEVIFMGLRTRKGFSTLRVKRLLGFFIPKEDLEPLLKEGLLALDGERVCPTLEGFLRHSLVVKYLWQVVEALYKEGGR